MVQISVIVYQSFRRKVYHKYFYENNLLFVKYNFLLQNNLLYMNQDALFIYFL
jgi:hypothetical protein